MVGKNEGKNHIERYTVRNWNRWEYQALVELTKIKKKDQNGDLFDYTITSLANHDVTG
jgi:hypothetical protein